MPSDLSRDWTTTEKGVVNASERYLEIVAAVESLIRGDAHALISGNVNKTARLIVSQLAHVHGLRPTDA
jgi:phosphotransacetylase